MSIEVEIRAKVFGGLLVNCVCDRDGVQDASFSSSGNRLPEKMYRRLVNSWCDMNEIWDNITEARKLREI